MTDYRQQIKAEAKRRIDFMLFVIKLDIFQQEDYIKLHYIDPFEKFEHHTCCFKSNLRS